MYIMADLSLKLCVLFLLIKYSELCAEKGCNWACRKCTPPPKPPKKPPCCNNPPCDYDEEVVFGPPKQPTPPGCRSCHPEPGACDPPSNPDVPTLFHPNADDEPPQFLAAIVKTTGAHICGAVIIAPHFVISNTRRCLSVGARRAPMASIQIAIGHFDPGEAENITTIKHTVKRIVLHPGCFVSERYNSKYDLALVEVSEKIVFDENVRAASFPPHTGWRANTNRNWYLSSFRVNHNVAVTPREAIWYVKVRVVQPALCKTVLRLDNQTIATIRPLQYYCTPYEHPTRKDGCKDDYGAALSYDNILFGILIFKYSCGRPRSVAAYVDLGHNRDWIAKKVQAFSKGAESITIAK